MTQILIYYLILILTQGDWKKHHGANKDLLYVIEPVIESLLQLLVQSILVYVVLGPSENEDNMTRTATSGEENIGLLNIFDHGNTS